MKKTTAYILVNSLCLTLLLSSCGLTGLNPFSGKGGPTVNANVLAGKENTQQVVAQQNRQDAGRDIIQTEIQKDVEAETVEEVKITNTNVAKGTTCSGLMMETPPLGALEAMLS